MTREEVFYALMDEIYELSRHISSYESVPRKYGTEDELYMVEAHTINLIGDKVRTNISELSQVTNKTKGAISQMVDKLVKREMVVKYRNPANNREVIVELTGKGKIVYDYHKELDRVNYGEALSKLNEFSTEDFLKYISISSSIRGVR